MDWLQIIALSLIQGSYRVFTRFQVQHISCYPRNLPTGPTRGLHSTSGVHFGTLIAVVIYFRVELTGMSRALINFPAQQAYTPEIDLAFKLASGNPTCRHRRLAGENTHRRSPSNRACYSKYHLAFRRSTVDSRPTPRAPKSGLSGLVRFLSGWPKPLP